MQKSSITASTSVPNDPLFGQQWYLSNSGSGYDLNLLPVWKDYTGYGIRIAVCDDGIQSSHPDLAANYDPKLSYNFVNYRNSGDPTHPDSNHGTSVAGVIAGVANNGKGVVGVAYDASLGSLIGDTLDEIGNCFDFAVDKKIDIINNSWGFDPFLDGGSDANGFFTSMQRAVQSGRQGLGILMTFAAGNERDEGWDANVNAINSSPYGIAVAAANRDGTLSSYSTPGSSILITGFGGESTDDSPGLITTDRTGRAGYTGGDYYQNDYDGYVGFNGTSAATPTLSGVIALMLEANPELGYRDVQEILAYSARMSEPSHSDWAYNQANNWNGGGLHTSRDFGFGLVDTLAAVRLAETWEYQSTFDNLATAVASSRALNLTIPDASPVGINNALRINQNLEIDHVTATLHLRHSVLSDLQIDLISPSGTRSTLLDNTKGEPDTTDFTWSFTSTQFWGESSLGNWKLIINDEDRGAVGRLMDWSLKVYGDDLPGNLANRDDTYIYTNEYAQFKGTQDAARRNLNDEGGNDTINVSAISDSVYLNLTPGAVSRLAGGNNLTISAKTQIETAYTGDGDDTLIGNAANNWLDGGRGADTLYGGAGADTLIGGTGQDWLTGGSGADVFLWSDAWNQNTATALGLITDFSAKDGDRLDLSNLDANLNSPGTFQSFNYIGGRKFTTAGQLRWDSKTQELQADRDGDLQMDLEIKLAGVSTFSTDGLTLA
ncbi:MAG: S8 family serine peptidase [Methylococcaceae bacterium]